MNAYLCWANSGGSKIGMDPQKNKVNRIREELRKIRNYSSCYFFPFNSSKKAHRVAESIAAEKQHQISNSEEVLAHTKKTDDLCLQLGEIQKRTSPNQEVTQKDNLTKEIWRRRDEWQKLFGVYYQQERKALKDYEIKIAGKQMWKSR